jgi:hypothetical protein
MGRIVNLLKVVELFCLAIQRVGAFEREDNAAAAKRQGFSQEGVV